MDRVPRLLTIPASAEAMRGERLSMAGPRPPRVRRRGGDWRFVAAASSGSAPLVAASPLALISLTEGRCWRFVSPSDHAVSTPDVSQVSNSES